MSTVTDETQKLAKTLLKNALFSFTSGKMLQVLIPYGREEGGGRVQQTWF